MKSLVETRLFTYIHMKKFETLQNIVKQAYRWFMVLVTLTLFIIVAYNVIRRYVFNNSIAWADELSRYMFIWVNLMGMISVFYNDELIGLDIFSKLIIEKTKYGKKILMIIEFVAISVTLGILTYYSIKFLSIVGGVSATLALPMKFVYSVLPFSMLCMFFGNFFKFVTAIRNK